tara:strand:+ start:112 stop:1197 length:1086 start_codon:yes stop_codon:yes gene_type:complete
MNGNVISIKHLSRISDKTTAEQFDERWFNLSPNFQRDFTPWDNKMQTRLIESILLQRAMNPLWVIPSPDQHSDEIFDGMHRCKTILRFLKGDFKLKGSELLELSSDVYDNRTFKKLSITDQQKINDFTLSLNKLSYEIRNDYKKMKDQYMILNRSSSRLNWQELNKVFMYPLFDSLKDQFDVLVKQTRFSKTEGSRFSLQGTLIEILANSTMSADAKWSSLPDMANKWIQKTFIVPVPDDGDLIKHVEHVTIDLKDTIVFLVDIIERLSSNDFPFSGNAEMEEKMFISRVLKFLVNKDNKMAILELMVRDLIGVFEELSQEGGDFQENKKENGNRNATFQQKCVKSIDEKLCDLFSIRRLQ